MDRLSVIGLLVGLLAIGGGQILEGGHLGSLSQPTALLIVVGGTLGAVMLQSPYATFVRGARMALDVVSAGGRSSAVDPAGVELEPGLAARGPAGAG
jgi:flagellar motor component MotA